MKKIHAAWLLILSIILILMIVLTTNSDEIYMDSDVEVVMSSETIIDITEYDRNTSYDEATMIMLQNDATSIMGTGAIYESENLIINQPGTYYLTGTLSPGYIQVSVHGDENVHMILDGVEILAQGHPAIYIESAGKVVISTLEGSGNIISDSAVYDKVAEIDASIYSNSDLTLNGEGSISVWGYYKDAIASKGMIKVVGGNYYLWAVDDGIKGRDGVLVTDGYLNIQVEGTCIKSTQNTNLDKGKVWIEGGKFSLIGGEHVISAVRNISVQNCEMFYQSILEPFSCQDDMIIDEGCITNESDE